jgi:4-oxalocrotonate tautomerase
MPYVTIKVFKGTLSQEKKKEMIEKVTDVVVAVEASHYPAERLKPYVWVTIEETEAENWGIGGSQCSIELLQAVLSGQGP